MSKKNNKLVIRRIIIIVILLVLIFYIINKIFLTADEVLYDSTVLMMGENIIELKDEIIVDTIENIYLSVEDVKLLYDENLEYNNATKTLKTSYGNHVVTLFLDSNEIIIDDNQENISGRMQFSNGKLYLPFSDMSDVYNFEYNYSSITNILIVDNISDKKETAIVKKNSNVKDGKSFFSKKATKIIKDEKVTILEKHGNYYKIRTKDGIIGYVKSSKIIE